MAQQPRRGRPRKDSKPVTVVGGELISWALPGGKRATYEMLSPDDLLTKKGWSVYREMTADDQIKACLYFKKVLIAQRPFEIVPASDSSEDKEVARFITENLKEVSLDKLLWEMLSVFEFGVSYGELLWEIGGSPPRLRLKDIKFRDPEYMYVHVDVHGNIKNFVQRPSQGPEVREITIEPAKMLHYAYQSQFSNHYGVSDLRCVYRAWWSKKYITQFWNVFLERFGAPLMKMTYPTGASENLKTNLKNIMTNLSSKTDVLVPEGVAVELIEATRGGTARYEEALAYYDNRIMTGMLLPGLLGMGFEVKKGSDSQSRLHLRTLMKAFQHIGNEISANIKEKIIKPLVDNNFNTDKYPEFQFQDYGEFESFEISSAIVELFNAGMLDPDQEDINYARAIIGLRTRDESEEDEVLRAMPPPIGTSPNDPNATGAGAGQGNDRAKKPASQKKGAT
jgi:phage gp29-like protein